MAAVLRSLRRRDVASATFSAYRSVAPLPLPCLLLFIIYMIPCCDGCSMLPGFPDLIHIGLNYFCFSCFVLSYLFIDFDHVLTRIVYNFRFLFFFILIFYLVFSWLWDIDVSLRANLWLRKNIYSSLVLML